MKISPENKNLQIQRFLNIASHLHVDLQRVLCNRWVRKKDNFIPAYDESQALKNLATKGK